MEALVSSLYCYCINVFVLKTSLSSDSEIGAHEPECVIFANYLSSFWLHSNIKRGQVQSIDILSPSSVLYFFCAILRIQRHLKLFKCRKSSLGDYCSVIKSGAEQRIPFSCEIYNMKT